MAKQFTCSKCGQALSFRPKTGVDRMRCPLCGQVNDVSALTLNAVAEAIPHGQSPNSESGEIELMPARGVKREKSLAVKGAEGDIYLCVQCNRLVNVAAGTMKEQAFVCNACSRSRPQSPSKRDSRSGTERDQNIVKAIPRVTTRTSQPSVTTGTGIRWAALLVLLIGVGVAVYFGVTGEAKSKSLTVASGQFLVGTAVLADALKDEGVMGFALLLGGLGLMYHTHARPLVTRSNFGKYAGAIVFAALVSMLVTAGTQSLGVSAIGDKIAKGATWHEYLIYPEHLFEFRAMLFFIIANLVMLIGAGYTFTAAPLPLLGHILTFFVGVALVEECSKVVAAYLIYKMLDDSNLDDYEKQRRVVWSFLIAGLGFGAGEALYYFGSYHGMDAGLSFYVIRSWWCVPLHASFALITGKIVARAGFFDGFFSGAKDAHESDLKEWELKKTQLEAEGYKPRRSFQRNRGPTLEDKLGPKPDGSAEFQFRSLAVLFLTLVYCTPAMALHALYDAFSLHGYSVAWLVGLTALWLGVQIVSDFGYTRNQTET